ncbi:hypothetical protein Tasa_017_177 [Tanticharoenia sakaeratensis NBRC 103193]|uniref:Uncharacterized protein n=1 Tax=Tanticharoenia sakaeratensis NBRC 103193 TaxID=1231623 RepID=A0A0D6MKW1_9PROT|nr:hypothetical protein Tasa_017_177 [Tanticharoenia sakaeratensis NBRC 103193]GBQ19027.1 hypothetical protein AA103193_0890 [Tanticharoenia sakaeratensis NBRC 103193]
MGDVNNLPDTKASSGSETDVRAQGNKRHPNVSLQDMGLTWPDASKAGAVRLAPGALNRYIAPYDQPRFPLARG